MIREKKTYYLIYTFFLVFFLVISFFALLNYTDQKWIYSSTALLFLLVIVFNYLIYKSIKRFMQIEFQDKLNEKKQEAGKRYRDIFENSANIIFIVNSEDYKIESYNKSFVRTFKRDGESFLGTSFMNMLDEQNQMLFLDNLKSTLNGASNTYELEIMDRGDGVSRIFSITNTLIADHDERVNVQCIGVDITTQKELQDELIEAKDKLQAVFDGMHIGISLISRDYDVMMVNEFQAKSLNEKPGNLIGMKCYKAFRNRLAVCENCPAPVMLKEKRPNSTEVKIRNRYGKLKYYNLFTYPIFDHNNELNCFISSVQDVTDVKYLESEVLVKDREIRMMEDVYISLKENLPLNKVLKNVLVTLLDTLKISRGLVFLMDKETKKKVLRARLGVPEGFISKLTELWGSEEIITEFMMTRSSITIGDIYENDKISFDLKKLFESESIELFTIIPIKVKKKVIGIVLMFSDKKKAAEEMYDLRLLNSIGREIGRAVEKHRISEKLKALKKELTKANKKISEKEKLESVNELAGVISHELNQPLTTIISYAEYLMSDSSEESNTYQTLKVIAEEAMRMSGMVKKISSITKYETNKYIGDTKIINIEEEKEEDILIRGIGKPD